MGAYWCSQAEVVTTEPKIVNIAVAILIRKISKRQILKFAS